MVPLMLPTLILSAKRLSLHINKQPISNQFRVLWVACKPRSDKFRAYSGSLQERTCSPRLWRCRYGSSQTARRRAALVQGSEAQTLACTPLLTSAAAAAAVVVVAGSASRPVVCAEVPAVGWLSWVSRETGQSFATP